MYLGREKVLNIPKMKSPNWKRMMNGMKLVNLQGEDKISLINFKIKGI